MRTLLASFLTLAALAVPSLASADDTSYGTIAPSDSPLAFRVESPAPARAMEMEGETKWNSPAMAITGGALTLVGAANVVAGAVVYAGDDCENDGLFGCAFDMSSTVGVASMVHGGLMMAVGIPLFVAGAYQVPKEGSKEPPRTAEVRLAPSRADLVMTW